VRRIGILSPRRLILRFMVSVVAGAIINMCQCEGICLKKMDFLYLYKSFFFCSAVIKLRLEMFVKFKKQNADDFPHCLHVSVEVST
jgi:hypothetical protein